MSARDRRLIDGELVELKSAGDVALLPEDVRHRAVRTAGIFRGSCDEPRHGAEQKLRSIVPVTERRESARSLDREHCGVGCLTGRNEDRLAFLDEIECRLRISAVILDERKQQQHACSLERLLARP